MQNDFEKQVRQKMDELKFVPTVPVWSRIEEQIRRKKDKRRLIIWLPLLGLLLAGGIYWINNEKGSVPAGQESVSEQKNTPFPAGTINDKKEKENEVTDESITSIAVTPAQTEQEKNKQSTKEFTSSKPLPIIPELQKNTDKQQVVTEARTDLSSKNIISQNPAIQKEVTNLPVEKKDVIPPPVDATLEKKLPEADEKQTFIEGKKLDENQKESGSPVLNNKREPVTNEDAENIDSVAVREVDRKDQKRKQSKWKPAVTARAGSSGLGDGIGWWGVQKEMMDPLVSSPQSPASVNSQPVQKNSNGFSFGVGAGVTRELSRRLNFNAGVQYNYYSSSFTVGKDSLSNFSGIRYYFGASTNADMSAYRNHYHFISIPVTIGWQVFKSAPVQLQAGVSLQQLVSSNALVYDPQYRIFYKSKEMMNNTQLFADLGLNYGFRMKRNTLLLGPQLQYGLSKMDKSTSKHLYAFGLQAQIIF